MANELYIHTLRQIRDGCLAENMDTEAEALEAAIQALSCGGDCISRQAVLDWLNDEWDGMVVSVFDGIRALPSAHPDLQPTCNQVATDCISRQAAIDAVTAWLHKALNSINQSKYNEGEIAAYETALSELKKIPSAQPEQQWIPCSERLPEESGEYLCTLVGVHNTGLPSECGYEPPNNHGIIPGWSTCEADGFKFLRDDEVLAWMPLPEPWRGES